MLNIFKISETDDGDLETANITKLEQENGEKSMHFFNKKKNLLYMQQNECRKIMSHISIPKSQD